MLYLHLLSLFAMVGGITVVGVCYFRLRAAASLIDAAPWARLADQTGWVFPPAILGYSRAARSLDERHVKWSTPWIAISIAGLALITLQGLLVAGPRAKALKHALDENEPGPLDVRARQLTRDRTLWIIILANPDRAWDHLEYEPEAGHSQGYRRRPCRLRCRRNRGAAADQAAAPPVTGAQQHGGRTYVVNRRIGAPVPLP